MLHALLVAFGGMLGSLLRYVVAGLVQGMSDGAFPAGTLAVNLAGSFLIGVVVTLSLDRGLLGLEARLFLAVGFCGGFTTMSTLSYETLTLLRDGQSLLALANAAGSVVACVTAVWLGMVVGRGV